jgi:hypothetical protein
MCMGVCIRKYYLLECVTAIGSLSKPFFNFCVSLYLYLQRQRCLVILVFVSWCPSVSSSLVSFCPLSFVSCLSCDDLVVPCYCDLGLCLLGNPNLTPSPNPNLDVLSCLVVSCRVVSCLVLSCHLGDCLLLSAGFVLACIVPSVLLFCLDFFCHYVDMCCSFTICLSFVFCTRARPSRDKDKTKTRQVPLHETSLGQR